MSARPCVRVKLGCKRCKGHAGAVLQQEQMIVDSSPWVDVLITRSGFTNSGIAKRYPGLRGKLAVPTYYYRYSWGSSVEVAVSISAFSPT
jgi:hypothetical protein